MRNLTHTMTALRGVILALTVTGLGACGGGGGGGAPDAASTASGSASGQTGQPVAETAETHETVITLMQLNDLHAHLTPHLNKVADGSGGSRVVERGGLARTASLIKEIRADNPNSLLMNIGDTYHGGAVAWFTLGNAIVDPVNALGIDVGVPGNWDFGYSSTIFRLRYTSESRDRIMNDADPLRPAFLQIKKPDFPNLAANLTYSRNGELVLPATHTRVVDGVTVGFIGLTSDIVKFVYPLLAPAFDFLGEDDDAETARAAYVDLVTRYASELREAGADVVVVMSELGIHKDLRLANSMAPDLVDVFFSAHTHEATEQPLQSDSGALVVEAGNDGYLGRMDLRVRDGKVIDRQWQLLQVTPDLADDPDVAALVERARAPFMAIDVDIEDPMPNSFQAFVQPLDTVIGTVDFDLDRRGALENSFNNAMTDLLRHYGETDLAMAPGFRFDSVVANNAMLEDNTVLNGEVTIEDAYRFFPMMFSVAKAEVQGSRLREIIEASLTRTFSAEAFNQRGGWLEGWSGLSLTVNLANPDGQRVVEMRLKESGEVIQDDDVVSVTGCKRPLEPRDMLCRHAGFGRVTPLFKAAFTTLEPWTMLDLLIEGLQTDVPFDSTRRDIIDLNSTAVWPATPFIQPIEGVQ